MPTAFFLLESEVKFPNSIPNVIRAVADRRRRYGIVLGGVIAFLICSAAHAVFAASPPLPFVSPMFGDNMVLQRGKTNTIWGWAKPGETIRVELAGQSVTSTANAEGRWQTQVLPPASSEALALRIIGSQTVAFTNILVGDVWLCGGQSNMELPLSRTRNGAAVIASAKQPNIRLFTVKSKAAYSPAAVVEGRWKVCSPATVTEDGGFSAVGYYFALKLRSETNVPVGLIKDCVGGTPAESWTSPETLLGLKEFDASLDEVKRLHVKRGPEYGNFIAHWYDEFDVGQRENWSAANLDDHDWKTLTLTDGFQELGVADAPSVCYFRKVIVLPNPLPSGPAVIRLGVVERMDTVYFNGQWIGASAWVENPRKYSVSAKILKPGTNVMTIRVLKTKPDGGFRSKPEELCLELGDKTKIPLAGEWKGKVSVDARPPHSLPLGFENWPTMPGVLYDGMIAPVAPFAISGALWYQGEANAGRAAQYRTLLPAMIADWRKTFGQGDFPFYIVSLAAFMQHRDQPGDDGWAELRAAQAFTARTVTNSGLAVAIDVGDANDIHPKDKKEVGDRLALLALANHYGFKAPCSGPTFVRVEEIPGALKLHFDHTDGGLVVKGDKLEEFSIAGADRKWFWADAKIEGGAVVVSSPKVPKPVAARYAWQSNPNATLFNGAGLPAAPFSTDDLPGVTEKAK
jgi:sialate O-acetylesterase